MAFASHAEAMTAPDDLIAKFTLSQRRLEAEYAEIATNPLAKHRRRNIQALLSTLRVEVEQLLDQTGDWLVEEMAEVYAAGAETVGVQVEMSSYQRSQIKEIAESTYDQVLKATSHMLGDSKRWAREAVREVSLAGRLEGLSSAQMAKRFAEMSPKALSDAGLPQPITAIIYADGSTRTMDTYAAMLLRTETALTYNRGVIDAGEAAPFPVFYEIHDGSDCGLTTHDDPQKAAGLLVSAETARRYPLSHPNCRRALSPRTESGLIPFVDTGFYDPSSTIDQRRAADASDAVRNGEKDLKGRNGRKPRPVRAARKPRTPPPVQKPTTAISRRKAEYQLDARSANLLVQRDSVQMKSAESNRRSSSDIADRSWSTQNHRTLAAVNEAEFRRFFAPQHLQRSHIGQSRGDQAAEYEEHIVRWYRNGDRRSLQWLADKVDKHTDPLGADASLAPFKMDRMNKASIARMLANEMDPDAISTLQMRLLGGIPHQSATRRFGDPTWSKALDFGDERTNELDDYLNPDINAANVYAKEQLALFPIQGNTLDSFRQKYRANKWLDDGNKGFPPLRDGWALAVLQNGSLRAIEWNNDPNTLFELELAYSTVATTAAEASQVMRESTASQLIHQWAMTSNNHNALSLAIQDAASSLFQLQASSWQMPQKGSVTGPGKVTRDESVAWITANMGAQLEDFLLTQYTATQITLENEGLVSVNLWRGISGDRVVPAKDIQLGSGEDHQLKVQLRPLSSFAAEPGTPWQFGEVIINGRTPIHRILSTTSSGVGCYIEHEYVVLAEGLQEELWPLTDSSKGAQLIKEAKEAQIRSSTGYQAKLGFEEEIRDLLDSVKNGYITPQEVLDDAGSASFKNYYGDTFENVFAKTSTATASQGGLANPFSKSGLYYKPQVGWETQVADLFEAVDNGSVDPIDHLTVLGPVAFHAHYGEPFEMIFEEVSQEDVDRALAEYLQASAEAYLQKSYANNVDKDGFTI